MTIGDNYLVVGPSFLGANAYQPLNCRIGMTYVAGYRLKRFRLPNWIHAHMAAGLSVSETINGEVVACLTKLDTRLAIIWAHRQGVWILSTWAQKRSADLKRAELREMYGGTWISNKE